MTNKEAIEILTQTQINLGRRNGKKAFTEALLKAIEALEKKPQGEWIKYSFKDFGAMGDWNYKCSNCSKVFGGKSNFCSNCGADMRQEEV